MDWSYRSASGVPTMVILVPEIQLAIVVMGDFKGWRGYVSFVETIEAIMVMYLANQKS